jgi:hypothetical protein
MKNILLLVTLSSLIFSCTSTKIVSTWRMPKKSVSAAKLNKVLVVALLYDEVKRRKAEIEMVKYLHGKGVVSYNYLDKLFTSSDEKSIAKTIASNGFDGVVILRLLNVDEVNTHEFENNYPGYYSNFGSYFYNSYPFFKSSEQYVFTKTYTVELTIFSIKEDKIIWSAITQSVNPNDVGKVTNEIIKVVYKRMKREGFLNE